MKTAISIPDEVFTSAEELAKQLGTSRSQLYTQALRDYLKQHRDDEITQKLNEVYSREDSSMDPVLRKLQAQTFEKEEW